MLFTLDTVYSKNASGAEQIPETSKFKSNINGLRVPAGRTGGERVGYLQAWSRIWSRDYREQIQLGDIICFFKIWDGDACYVSQATPIVTSLQFLGVFSAISNAGLSN